MRRKKSPWPKVPSALAEDLRLRAIQLKELVDADAITLTQALQLAKTTEDPAPQSPTME